jgi:hypothetical protein
MKNSGFDSKRVKDAMRQYNEPPETPRETIWSRIQAQRAQSRVTDISWRRRLWSSPRMWVPAAAAAVLVIGISIGRFTAPAGDGGITQNETPVVSPVDDSAQSPRGTIDNNTAYRMAATPVLKKAELLLTQFSAGDSLGENGNSFSSRATKLLTDTRMLLDSPAAEDPELKRVLSDLELVLTQIVRLAEAQEQEERDSIDENMKNRSLLPRLRATSPTGTFKITT